MKPKFTGSMVFETIAKENLSVKKCHLYFMIVLCISFNSMIAYTQSGNPITPAQKINRITYDERDTLGYFTLPEKAPEILLNDININAIRHFNASFENPLHVKWYKIPGGFSVYFMSDSIKKMAAYTNKGTWIHTLSFYDEHKLPGYVRHLVKSVYYDFMINRVIQIEEDSQLVYMIQIEDATSFKTVAVSDYEMKIVKDLRKAK